VGSPGIYPISALSAFAENVVAVEDNKIEAKSILEFILPLEDDRWWARDNDRPHLLAHDQFAQDQTSFNSLAESNIIGYEKVSSRKLERLPQRFELICLNLDSRTIRGLKQARICRSDEVPPQSVEVGGKLSWRVKSALGNILP
jgi:hypothetical protein